MNQNEYYTLPNAMVKLGVTYKTIRYYAEHELFANDESLVRFEGKKKWVSEKFIEKVRHNLETNSSRFKDPRTKDELIGEVERLNGLYNEATKKIEEFIEPTSSKGVVFSASGSDVDEEDLVDEDLDEALEDESQLDDQFTGDDE